MTGYVKQQYSSPGSSVTGLLSNGSRIECDLLIGADGIHSKARRLLLCILSHNVPLVLATAHAPTTRPRAALKPTRSPEAALDAALDAAERLRQRAAGANSPRSPRAPSATCHAGARPAGAQPVRPRLSGYTCFAAIAQCVPDDIKEVGYKVFLGERKFFVCVDVGGGRLQWCVLPRKARPTTSNGP